MKRVLLALALLGLGAGMASAQVTDLSGGVFIAHHDPNINMSPPLEGWCQHYIDNYAISSCEEQNPSIMTFDERIFFLLSAWGEDKEWCGTEFGMGQFDPYCFVFTTWGPCSPGGNLEIPTGYWPGPGEGTAIVTTDLPWFGDFEPVYYFTGYAYYGYCQILFDVDPPTGFGGWGNCLTPPEEFMADCFPAMGINMGGIECCPSEPEHPCCIGEVCYMLTETECVASGGEPHPEWPDCGPPDPCAPEPMGACCVGEDCYYVTEAECNGMQGEYLGDDTDCGPPNPCEYFRAVCCVCIDCFIVTEDECMDMMGDWHPEWDSCDPNPCPPSPSESTSWGTIKAIYR
jgi:hypothetical protein